MGSEGMALAPDINAQICQDFPEADAHAVVELLTELQRENTHLFVDRVLRCLVAVAHGSVDMLLNAIVLATVDVRDLIMAAEYDRQGNQIHDFHKPFGLRLSDPTAPLGPAKG
jgi:hypothetical protein